MTEKNDLNGSIPTEIGNLSELEFWYMCEWAFLNCLKNDSHPVRLSYTFLVLLDSSRMTGGNDLIGPIPSEIGNLSKLYVLSLCDWAFINRVMNDSHPVKLSHTFLVLLDSFPPNDSPQWVDWSNTE
jgi:hypothetical protein